MAARGEQDTATPTQHRFAGDEFYTRQSTVKASSNCRRSAGYKPGWMKMHTGNYIYVILDTSRMKVYNLDHEFELRNVADGQYMIRVFHRVRTKVIRTTAFQ
jgi:hypothetical protein